MVYIAALALGGCVTDPSPPPGEAASVPTRLDFDACFDQTGRFPTPVEELRPYVPSPLEPALLDPAGAMGQRFVIAAGCRMLAGDSIPAEDVHMMLSTIPVEGPPEYFPEDAFGAVVMWFHVSDEALATIVTSWGAADVRSDAAFSVNDGPVRAGHATSGDISFDVVGGTPEGSIGDDLGRTFFVREGALAGAMDWALAPAPSVRRGSAMLSDGSSGLGGHFWGDGYAYNWTAVPLDAFPPG